MTNFVLGCDPGLSGALAFYRPDTGALQTHDMPTLAAGKGQKSARIIDRAALASMLDRDDIAHAWVESVGARPGEAPNRAFTFGLGYGVLLGILAANFIPLTLVTPNAWKKALRVPASKEGARARASELLPRHAGQWPLAKHDGRAESAMIALYGARQLGARPTL